MSGKSKINANLELVTTEYTSPDIVPKVSCKQGSPLESSSLFPNAYIIREGKCTSENDPAVTEIVAPCKSS